MITYSISGRVRNARNKNMLSGITVSVDGTSKSTTTSFGTFTLHGVPAGDIKLKYNGDGFIDGENDIDLTGNINIGGDADINMSPSMAADQWRAVLKWNQNPRDLDTHVFWGWTQVYYAARNRRASGLGADLEVDVTSGYGPETTFFKDTGSCNGGVGYFCDMKYKIYKYSGSGSMMDKGAEVTLYHGDSVAGHWEIKDCPGSVTGSSNGGAPNANGRWWEVFHIDGRNNQLKWSCNQGPPSLNLLSNSSMNATQQVAAPKLRAHQAK